MGGSDLATSADLPVSRRRAGVLTPYRITHATVAGLLACGLALLSETVKHFLRPTPAEEVPA